MPSMNSRFVAGLRLAAYLGVGITAPGWGCSHPRGEVTNGTVHVARATGDRETDRANIIAALEEVEPGGTVQLGTGTYVIGSNSLSMIDLTTPRITFQGHPRGSTLRGCSSEAFSADDCLGLELTGGHQTVRDITFEYFSYALQVGGLGYRCSAPGECAPDGTESLVGGYLVEGNTFRNVIGMGARGNWQQPAVIRGNTFINVFHAVSVIGGIAHVLGNDVSVTDPGQIPSFGHPGGAISILAHSGFMAPSCDNNVIAGNRIVGHPESINVRLMAVNEPEGCSGNVIRDNTIVNSRIPGNPAFPYASGAILLINETDRDGLIEGTRIEGNRIIDSDGVAIAVFCASRNHIVNNTISRLGRLDSGLLHDRVPQDLANGSAIWISRGSDQNEIIGNVFAEIAAHAVVLEGSGNVVTSGMSDSVRDLGHGNRVTDRRTR
jgi:hypothetical protein